MSCPDGLENSRDFQQVLDSSGNPVHVTANFRHSPLFFFHKGFVFPGRIRDMSDSTAAQYYMSLLIIMFSLSLSLSLSLFLSLLVPGLRLRVGQTPRPARRARAPAGLLVLAGFGCLSGGFSPESSALQPPRYFGMSRPPNHVFFLSPRLWARGLLNHVLSLSLSEAGPGHPLCESSARALVWLVFDGIGMGSHFKQHEEVQSMKTIYEQIVKT